MSPTLTSQEAAYISHLARVALVGILLAVTLVAALHRLSPELDPITRAMSDYVHGRYGRLMTAAFAGLGVSLCALAAAFRWVASSATQSWGGLLLAIAGVATLVAGVFPIDNTLDGRFSTARGAVHAVAGFCLSPLVVGAMLCLSAPWNRIGDSSNLQAPLFLLTAATTVAYVLLLVVNNLHWPIGGIGQRVFMVLVCLWLLLTSARLLVLAGAQG